MKLIIESTIKPRANGCYACSVVIRDKGKGEHMRYVVHTKIYPHDMPDTDNAPFYHKGNYCNSFVEAASYFEDRCKALDVE